MKSDRGFDEVMIVNPAEPGHDYKGARLMRFHDAMPQGWGYYSEPPEAYGYYAEPPDPYGYYAEQPDLYGYYGESPEAYGYYGEPPEAYGYYGQLPDLYGYYAEPRDAYGYYAQPPEAYGYYAEDYGATPGVMGYAEPPAGMEPVGYYAEEYPVGYYADPSYGYYAEDPYAVGQYDPLGYYGETPEMVGYGEADPYAQAGMGFWGDPGMSGYVRASQPTYNAGCPMPTNVAGLGEVEGFEGYIKPATVNPRCDQFTSQPGEPIATPEGFKPLW